MNDNNHDTKFKIGNTYGKGRPLGSRNRPKPFTKDEILRDIQEIYLHSLGNHNWGTALQAKLAQSKLMGMLRVRKLPNITRLRDMNEDELRDFNEMLEENEPAFEETTSEKDELIVD
jgi:hypothetical protein